MISLSDLVTVPPVGGFSGGTRANPTGGAAFWWALPNGFLCPPTGISHVHQPGVSCPSTGSFSSPALKPATYGSEVRLDPSGSRRRGASPQVASGPSCNQCPCGCWSHNIRIARGIASGATSAELRAWTSACIATTSPDRSVVS